MGVFDEIGKDAVARFVRRVSVVYPDVMRGSHALYARRRYYRDAVPFPELRRLEERWYNSLRLAPPQPDYGIYDDAVFTASLYACWLVMPNEIGRLFIRTLREHGYEQARLGLWNNRPTIWQRR